MSGPVMRGWIAAGIALCAGMSPVAAPAQSPLETCVVSAPSFSPTEADRCGGESVDASRAKQALVFQRPNRRHPNCEMRYTVPPDRGDGSFAVICEVRCGGQGGHSWIPCTAGVLPGRTTGVATCTGGVTCT